MIDAPEQLIVNCAFVAQPKQLRFYEKRWKSGLPVERVNDRSPLRSNRNLNAMYKRKRNMSLSCVVYLKVYNKESLTGGLKTREKCF